jgi:hypothetical protein
MHNPFKKTMMVLLLYVSGFALVRVQGAINTTIDPANRYAYGANLGWIDWGNTANGAVIGQYYCAGNLYVANAGWINLGGGAPLDGIHYQNLSATDFGINNDGLGNLRGYAYGANIGWINFEANGAPKVDLKTGKFSGSIYSANCGWISLNNAVAFVQTDTLWPGELDVNGLPIAWELTWFGTTGINPAADPDGDGMSNEQEYVAGTNPLNGTSDLMITDLAVSASGNTATITWSSVPTRLYYLEESPSLNAPVWSDSGLGLISPDVGSSTTRTVNQSGATRFYRVRAVLPLSS